MTALSIIDLSGVGGDFAGNVGSNLLGFAVKTIGRLAVGDPEAQLIQSALERATRTAADGLRPEGLLHNPDLDAAVQDALQTVLSESSVRDALVEAAVSGQGELQTLTQLAERAGLDVSTLPFLWTDFLLAFLAAFEREMRWEGSRTNSPLHGRLALGELFRLRAALTRCIENPEDRVDYLVHGLIEVDANAPFKQFLFEYLGHTDRPKPFGGRAFEIDTLNDWLVDGKGTKKILLLAPAGRGKSALLAHWVRQLPRDIGLVFVPISLRFQTADPMTFLPALALKLAQLHGSSIGPAALRDISACRAAATNLMMRELPNGRPLLIIVDGLDEAGLEFHWGGLFPAILPDSVRVVVAARHLALDDGGRAWLTRLAWDGFTENVRPFELSGLDHGGVAEVLQSMALEAPNDEAPLARVDEIWRLSEGGDPLLVGLYAEQLWQQRREYPDALWRVEELRRLDPGLKAFFERWAQDQEAMWGDPAHWNETTARSVLMVSRWRSGRSIRMTCVK